MATKYGPQPVPPDATHYRPAYAYYSKGTIHAYPYRASGHAAAGVPLCGANPNNNEVAGPTYQCQPPTCPTCARLVARHQLQPLHWCPSCEGYVSVRPTEPGQDWAYCEACQRTGLDSHAPEPGRNYRADCGRLVAVAQQRAFPFAQYGAAGQREQWATLSRSAKAPLLRWARFKLKLPHVAVPLTAWPYDS
jgi:hypothetical protein